MRTTRHRDGSTTWQPVPDVFITADTQGNIHADAYTLTPEQAREIAIALINAGIAAMEGETANG